MEKNAEIDLQILCPQKDSRINSSRADVPRAVGPVRLDPSPVVLLVVGGGVACNTVPRQQGS